MSSIRLRLVGGPHHDKDGWFQDPNDTPPDVIYVTPLQSGEAILVADPHGPFATGPFDRYHYAGVEPSGHVIYNYLPEGK